MTRKEFRAQLKSLMPGYTWTIHRPMLKQAPPGHRPHTDGGYYEATGVRLDRHGRGRTSTIKVHRNGNDGTFGCAVFGRSKGPPNSGTALASDLRVCGLEALLATIQGGIRNHARALTVVADEMQRGRLK